MQNGYFQLVNESSGYGIALYQPRDCGEEIRLQEVQDYLKRMKVDYDRKKLEMLISFGEDVVCHLGEGACPVCQETYTLELAPDGMLATVRFIPPSEGGERLTLEDFLREMEGRKIVYGLQTEGLMDHFGSRGHYCTDIMFAKGKYPVEGKDARIEYLFNTEMHKRPAHKEDGRVDYFNLSTINFCRQGDVLARIIPEVPGERGTDIYGKDIKPREVKKETLKFGKNIELSEDKLTITATVDGHVALSNGKVSVDNVYQVKDVGVSTGNIDFEGSIQISGNVAANFEVKAGGNVIVNGLVEAAKITAGGNIIIAKGMNGMGKGYLRAGGDVVVKFLENVRVVTGGYVETDALLHCSVSSGSDVRVDGRRGMIVGGYIQAANSVVAKTIGGSMGAQTTIEVGVNPMVKSQYDRVQTEIENNEKTINAAKVVLDNFKEKLKKGVKFNERQLKYMRSVEILVRDKGTETEQLNMRLEKLKARLETQKQAEVVVSGQAYPNTTIIVGDVTKTLHSDFRYCKFVKEEGEVKMVPL